MLHLARFLSFLHFGNLIRTNRSKLLLEVMSPNVQAEVAPATVDGKDEQQEPTPEQESGGQAVADETTAQIVTSSSPQTKLIFAVGAKGTGIANHCALFAESSEEVSTVLSSKIGAIAANIEEKQVAPDVSPDNEIKKSARDEGAGASETPAVSDESSTHGAETKSEENSGDDTVISTDQIFSRDLQKVAAAHGPVCIIQVEAGNVPEILAFARSEVRVFCILLLFRRLGMMSHQACFFFFSPNF